jgi:type II secretory pathway predicted ATPase ExeA
MLALKLLLQQHNISQALLARELNLAPATIAQWLNKEIYPKTPTTDDLKAAVIRFLRKQTIAFDDTIFNTVAAETATPLTEEDMNMLLRKQTLSPQAKAHFKFFQDPFENDVQAAEDVYSSPDIRFVREYLWQTAKQGGFIAVIGESGAGKSTLRKDLIDRVYREDAPIIIIEPVVLGMEDNDVKGKTLKAASIADAIIRTLSPLDKPKLSMEAKGRQLQQILKNSRRAGFNHCLVIEEAHALSVPTLKHLKRFFELEDGFKKLLSIVLIGQTELKTKLSERAPEVREVVQRCELIELSPLDSHLEDYLRFKFERVGSSLDAVFDKNALDAIRERLIFSKSSKNSREVVSLMYPLMINNLITGAMNEAARLGFPSVSFDLIKEA